MSKKFREARQMKNRELTTRDRANRCGYCKINMLHLLWPPLVMLDGRKFCSEACVNAATEKEDGFRDVV